MRKMLFLSKGIQVIPEVVSYNKKIGFVPTASDLRDSPHFTKRTYRQLQAWGYDIIDISISKLSKEEITESLKSIDALFIAGGDVHYLMQQMNQKDFKEIVTKRMDEGMLFIGESAGACVACDDIAYIRPMDNPKFIPDLDSTKGLGLFPIPLIPHADHPRHGDIATQIANDIKLSISLNEDQAIFVTVGGIGNISITPVNSILGPGFKAENKRYF